MKKTLLIIDDEQDWCEILLDSLWEMDEYVLLKPINDSSEALREIETTRPDILVLDLIMPVVDGFYIINHVREQLPGYRPFIYVVSAAGTKKTNELMRHLDVNYYSVKPIRPTVIMDNLRRMLADEDILAEQIPIGGSDRIEHYVEEYIIELGGNTARISTKCAIKEILYSIIHSGETYSASKMHQDVGSNMTPPMTAASCEHNVRSCVNILAKNNNEYFQQVFTSKKTKVVLTDFVDLSRRTVIERIRKVFHYNDKISFGTDGKIYNG